MFVELIHSPRSVPFPVTRSGALCSKALRQPESKAWRETPLRSATAGPLRSGRDRPPERLATGLSSLRVGGGLEHRGPRAGGLPHGGENQCSHGQGQAGRGQRTPGGSSAVPARGSPATQVRRVPLLRGTATGHVRVLLPWLRTSLTVRLTGFSPFRPVRCPGRHGRSPWPSRCPPHGAPPLPSLLQAPSSCGEGCGHGSGRSRTPQLRGLTSGGLESERGRLALAAGRASPARRTGLMAPGRAGTGGEARAGLFTPRPEQVPPRLAPLRAQTCPRGRNKQKFVFQIQHAESLPADRRPFLSVASKVTPQGLGFSSGVHCRPTPHPNTRRPR